MNTYPSFKKSLLFAGLILLTGCSYTTQDLPETVYTKRMGHSVNKANVALLIASDSDRSHKAHVIRRKLESNGHKVVAFAHLPNDQELIEHQLHTWISQSVDAIICVGGTGLDSRDNTIEAIDNVVAVDIPGYGELLRYLTYKKWSSVSEEMGILAMDTRAKAGKINQTVIFAVPGSPDAVDIALDKLIIPDLPHLAGHMKE